MSGQQVIWKGKRKRFLDESSESADEGSPIRIKWVDDKYLSTVKGLVALGKGSPASRMREEYYRSLSPTFVSPILAISRDWIKYDAHKELATYAIQCYNTHHEQTKFEVVDLMSVIQKVHPTTINNYLTFTAKNLKAEKYLLKEFTTKITVSRPSCVTEVVSCDLKELKY